MKNSWFHQLINYYILRKKYHSNEALAIKSMGSLYRQWFTEVWCGRTNMSATDRSACQIYVAICKTIEKINGMLLTNPKLEVQEIVEVISISRCSVVLMLSEYLCIRNLSVRLVQRLLTIDRTRNHDTFKYLELSNCNPDEFLL